MRRRVIDGCHEAIWAILDHFCAIYGAWNADRWDRGSPALCFSLGEANCQNVIFAKMALNHLQEPRDIDITQCKHGVIRSVN